MKALILNSGVGSRMGRVTKNHPKCMTELDNTDTILSRQLRLLCGLGIRDVVITTGYYNQVLKEYCYSLGQPLQYEFVNNEKYKETNYIYSIYCARKLLQDDILLMHGDLVFSEDVLKAAAENAGSCMVVSSAQDITKKDFKAVVVNGQIQKIGVEYFKDTVMAQPLYKLNRKDWEVWLKSVVAFCESGNVKCYAENAFNAVSDACTIYPLDVKEKLCCEIDTQEDLAAVKRRL